VDDAKAEEPGALLVEPRPPHQQDNWLEFIGAGVVGGFASGLGANVYNDVKATFQAAVNKYHGRRPDPGEKADWVPGDIMEIYEHFIYGPMPDALEAVACELTHVGYLVPDPPEISATCDGIECPGCDSHWLLMAYGTVEKAFADGGRDDIDEACATHGVTYDGGGCLVN
jgi:hypothetical protein